MNIEYNIEKLKIKAAKEETSSKSFFAKLKKQKNKRLDLITHEIHDKVFDQTDCLECANCCRSLGPRISDKDISRISKSMKIKTADFIDKYLRIDEDNDYVFKSMPCPFLGNDNYCFIYEIRPKACREYPHTDRKKFSQLFNLTIKNSFECPAVFEIIEQLKNTIK